MKNKLRLYRFLAGLTQEELARKLNLSQPLISVYELGKHTPYKKRRERIAKVLGKNVSTVFPVPKKKKVKK